MNDLAEIEKLYAKPKEYLIPKNPKTNQAQMKIFVRPMSLESMPDFNTKEDAPMSEVIQSARKLIAVSLEINEDEAKKISFEFLQDMVDAIMDANNFTEADAKKTGVNKIKSFLESKNKQITEQKNEQSSGSA